jgi:hypothetical protein
MTLIAPIIQMAANTRHKGIVGKAPAISSGAVIEGIVLVIGCTGITGISGICTERKARLIRGRKGNIQAAVITSQTIYRHLAVYRFDKRGNIAIYTRVIRDMETEH